MSYSPTIIAASLDDKELQASINKMVASLDKGLQDMLDHTNTKVNAINEALKKVGVTNASTKGSDDGGAAKRTKAQNAETDAVEKNVVARDKQIKKNKEVEMSFDQMAKAQQVAIRSANPDSVRNADTLQTMRISLDLLIEKLREARSQYTAYVAMARDASTTGDKGYYQMATAGVHKYEEEVRDTIAQIRALRTAISQMGDVIAPQGHTLQNYVNSLVKANPELALLNEQFKKNKSLLQQQKTEFEQNAQAQRGSANATNQQKQTLDEINAYMRQNIQREQERRDAIRQTGLAARETTNQLIRSAHEQASSQSSSPITGIKELTVAVEQMRRAYFDMSASEKSSPIGLALEADIKRANDAIAVIRKYNQSLLGSQQDNANKITNASTLNSLRESLKNLTEQYNRLTVAELNAGKGDALIQHFQDTTRAAQILQRTLNRPVSLKAALAGDERTLDDIAYKMQRLRAYKQGIDLTKPNAANEIKQVDEALVRLQKDADKWMSKSNEMIKSNTAIGRSWNYMKNRLAFYFTVGASTQFIKNLIEVRSQYEMNERALGVLINSAERGKQIFQELSNMALVSPYTLIELSTAAKQLTAYDVAAKDVVDTTRRLADMAAAVGIPIERLTYALGQIKAYGYLNSRDARMFANAGIPLVKQLSDYYTELEGKLVSTADVYDRIKKKAIDYNEVMEVINKMTDQGGKFFDFQAKMADTLKVRLANLTLAWNNMLNDMGKEEQGVLTWGIGALREMFLHWKQLDSLIKNAAWALGIRTALMFIAWGALKAGNAFGIMSKQMALSAVFGTKLANVLKNVGYSVIALAKNKWTWISLFAVAAVEASKALLGVNEAQKALNESIRNGAKDNYNNIKKFSEQYQEVRETLYKSNGAGGRTPVDIDNNEAKKVWDAIREQIELTVTSSDEYIGKLLTIENMSERVRQAFNLLDDVLVVNAALKEIDDNTIKVTQDWDSLLGTALLPEGLISDLKDFAKEENSIIEKFGSLSAAREKANQENEHARVNLQDYDAALKEFRSELEKTTQSVLNFIQVKGWSGDEGKINQVFEQITQKIVLDNQLDPQEAFTLQTEMEEARSKAAKQAQYARVKDIERAYYIEKNKQHKEELEEEYKKEAEIYNNWDNFNGRKKVEWERFTKWLKEQHISETTAMFRNMDAEDIRSLNFQEGKHAEWVKRMVTQYAKEHKMSYDEAFKYLKSWVVSANQWSIFIPMTISTEDSKTVYKQLGEYDKAVDEADAQIARLTTRINELNAKKKKSKEETKELADAEKELTQAQKDKADAEAKGGHGKKEKKDEKAAEKAAKKAAKQSETELQKALKDELSVIEKVRSIYKELTKEGMSHANAVELATEGWDETVNAINRILQKNGLQRLDLAKFVGVANPRELVNMLQSQLDVLVRRGAKPAEIKEFQATIRTLNVDASKYDLTMITNGLNNELDRLKEEYELSVALDADPELGGIFANYMGINLEDLPKTAEEAAKKAQEYIDKILVENNSSEKIDISSLMDKKAFDSWVESSGHNLEDGLVKAVSAFRSYLHKVNVDETKNQAQEWNKLLEKYAEYEYKVTHIQKEAEREREIARKKGASQEILDAIDNWEKQELARLEFEEFQKSPEWIVATGDVADMAKSAIGMLINELERYKKSAKNLSPKQIKQLNSALSKLYKEQRKNSPFKAISNMMQEAKERMATFDEEIKELEEEIEKTTDAIDAAKDAGEDTSKQMTALDELIKKWQELKDKQQETGKIDASSMVGAINETIGAVQQGIGVFNDLAKAIGGVNTNDLDKVFSVIEKGGMGAATGAMIGGGVGAIIGAVAGIATGLISVLAGAANERITEKVEKSERAVKALENTYRQLEHTASNAYGAITSGAKKALQANKELQLIELQRQLTLEKSRDSKDRDESKILDLEGQIIDLKNEIHDATQEIINDLLGISSAGEGIESMVEVMIEAFRNGEDAMEAFSEKWDEMIDNMTLKLIVTTYMQKAWDELMSRMQEKQDEMMKSSSDAKATAQKEVDRISEMSDEELGKELYKNLGIFGKVAEVAVGGTVVQSEIDAYRKAAQAALTAATTTLDNASFDYTKWSLDYMNTEGREFMDRYAQMLKDSLGEWYTYGENAENNLSSLQQGISGITEDTANAVEAYLNGMSQQAYLRNDLLTQIRDTVQSFDLDVQTATQAQMLLQLQNNYIVMQSMQSMMENWTVPSGNGIRVELLS